MRVQVNAPAHPLTKEVVLTTTTNTSGSASTPFAVDSGSRRITFKAYPYGLDRDGETIRPEAWLARLQTYLSNPVVSAFHDTSSRLPVGKAVRVWVNPIGYPDPGLMAEVEFASHQEADDVYQCYKGGFLNAVSIMAMPYAWEDKGKDFPGQTGRSYTDVELMDISCVVIPSNPEALAVSRALKLDQDGNGNVTPEKLALIKSWERLKETTKKMQTQNKDKEAQVPVPVGWIGWVEACYC